MRVGVLGDPLQAQRDGALDPTLLSAQEALRRLRHAVGQFSVDEVGILADEHAVETTGGVLDLAARMKLLALDQLGAEARVAVADALQPALPDRRVVAVGELPHPVGAARAHPTTTIADHRVQSEELGVVVVQVVELVLIFRVVLRGLGEGDPPVQVPILLEEARYTRDEEVRLELVAGVGNPIQRWRLVLLGAVAVLRPVVHNGDVVVDEV
mmetsp:Transcript_85155/g.238515  ORF Transcript_85155/g.238515 Transcript_85155/m.238515 type:complete len:212 (+) Transcript_85155:1457-2092(+)